jgi:hypothetical protein
VSVAIGLCIAGIDRVSFWSTHVHESTVDAPLALDPGQRRTSDAWTFERTGAHASTATRRREVQMGQTRDHVGGGMAWGRYRLAVIGARVQMRTCIECSRAVVQELSQRLGGFIGELPWQSSVHASGGELVEHASGRGPSGDSSLIDCRCSRLRLPELGRQTGS